MFWSKAYYQWRRGKLVHLSGSWKPNRGRIQVGLARVPHLCAAVLFVAAMLVIESLRVWYGY
jgi:hypothetical protein